MYIRNQVEDKNELGIITSVLKCFMAARNWNTPGQVSNISSSAAVPSDTMFSEMPASTLEISNLGLLR
jgi:hypothetical protein